MITKKANGCSNDNYSKEFDMKMPSWRCTCWRAGVSRVRLGGRPAGVDVGLPGGVSFPCVNDGYHQHPARWLQDKKSSSARGEKNSPSRSIGSGAGVPVSEASRGLFDVCSGVGASSRGRLLAESLGVVLIEERRTKRTRAERNSEED